jgi:hypothetical protein
VKHLAALRALFVLVLLGTAPAVRASDATVDPDWFPLRAGSEWVYEVHRDQTYRPDDAGLSRLFHAGRNIRTASAASDRTPGGFVVREIMKLVPVDLGERETLLAWMLLSFQGELRMHATGETGVDGTEDEVVYDKPLRILPTTTAGASWNAGVFRSGGLSAPIRGEVIGIEDLEGSPRWSGALKVRLHGSISGKAANSNEPTEVESGEFERLIWFAKGVGIVREVTTMELELKLPDDRRAHTIQVLTLRLLEHRGAK